MKLINVFVAGALSLFLTTEIFAQPAGVSSNSSIENPFSERGATLPSVMRWLQSQNVKLTSLGEDGGLKGYLGEASNGRHQVFYPTPDGEHMLAGVMFKSGGVNVTNIQIARMLNRFSTVAKNLEDIDTSSLPDVPEDAMIVGGLETPFIDWMTSNNMKVTAVDGDSGGLKGYVVETPSGSDGQQGKMQFFYVLPDETYAVAGIMTRRGGVNVTGLQVAEFQQKYQVAAAVAGNSSSEIKPGPNPPTVPPSILVPDRPDINDVGGSADFLSNPPAPVLDVKPISTSEPSASDRFIDSTISADDFVNAVNTKSVFFTVGAANTPAVYMVADPQCPFCHQTWAALRPLVLSGKLQVRVIMIAGLRGSDVHARSILSQPDPGSVWLAGQGSMSNVRIDSPPAVGTEAWNTAGEYLMMNHAFIDLFKITRTPFVAYVDKSNRLISSRGVPDNFNDFLAAIE